MYSIYHIIISIHMSYPYIYLSYLSIYLLIYLSYLFIFMYLSIYLPIYVPIYLSIHLSIYLSIHLSIYLSYLSIYLSIIYLFIHLSIYLSHLSFYVSYCLSIDLSTYHSCRSLQSEGFHITYLPVKANGIIDLDELKKELKPETVLVSIMGVNNEIGVIQPLKEIGKV